MSKLLKWYLNRINLTSKSVDVSIKDSQFTHKQLNKGTYLLRVNASETCSITINSASTSTSFSCIASPTGITNYLIILDQVISDPQLEIASNNKINSISINASFHTIWLLDFLIKRVDSFRQFSLCRCVALSEMENIFSNIWLQWWDILDSAHYIQLDRCVDDFMTTNKAFNPIPINLLKIDPLSTKLIVCLHLYYEDMWNEIAYYLQNIPVPFQLWITTPYPSFDIVAQLQQAFPGIIVTQSDTDGYDSLPFALGIKNGILNGFTLGLKIHTKGAHQNGQPTRFGSIWRKQSLQYLLGSVTSVTKIMKRFDDDQRLGVLGPEPFRMPNSRVSRVQAIAGLKEIMDIIWSNREHHWKDSLDFFAGTMFWFRPSALQGVSDYKLPDKLLESKTHGIAYALERLLPTTAAANNWKISSIKNN